ncbi:MAG TPA: hypothetical protein ENH26_03170 [Candidatus Wolfebacteria bacterium]|nr:hypothetical protein [Candidatus Wolfebacteria bacterium]
MGIFIASGAWVESIEAPLSDNTPASINVSYTYQIKISYDVYVYNSQIDLPTAILQCISNLNLNS